MAMRNIRYGDRFWSHDSFITMMIGLNTYQLFQRFGGIDMPLMKDDVGGTVCLPFTREEGMHLVETMTRWLTSENAQAAARAVESDLIFVRRQIAHLKEVLQEERWFGRGYFCFSMFGNDDLEWERLRELADGYSDAHWASCAE